MATITHPSVKYTQQVLTLHRYDIDLTSPFTAVSQVLQRGVSHWTGINSYPQFGFGTEKADSAAEVEAFIAQMESSLENICEIPLQRNSATVTAGTTVSSTAVDGTTSELVTTLSTGLSSPKAGQFVRSGNYLLQIARVVASNRIVFTPDRLLAVDAGIKGATTVRVRAVGSGETSSPMPRSASAWGPWELRWREALR